MNGGYMAIAVLFRRPKRKPLATRPLPQADPGFSRKRPSPKAWRPTGNSESPCPFRRFALMRQRMSQSRVSQELQEQGALTRIARFFSRQAVKVTLLVGLSLAIASS